MIVTSRSKSTLTSIGSPRWYVSPLAGAVNRETPLTAGAGVSCAAAPLAANRPAARIAIRHARCLMSRRATGDGRAAPLRRQRSEVLPESVILCLCRLLIGWKWPRVRSLTRAGTDSIFYCRAVNRLGGIRPIRSLHDRTLALRLDRQRGSRRRALHFPVRVAAQISAVRHLERRSSGTRWRNSPRTIAIA